LKYRVKRFMDLVLASLALIMLLPFFLVIALAIKLDSKGPVFYLQERLTRDGRIFHMYKFRTMIVNAEQMGTGLFSYADDFRVTRVGNFLRKISLNETPQFINVLKGDMALVGPRPPVKYELGDYNDLDDTYKKRFTVLPGITGLAQVNGRNELTWDQKVFFDNRYIDLFSKYGILVDLKILTLTVIYVLTMKGAYEMQGEKVGGDPDRLSGGDI
jgi:lipopolysaccharide/colanic/teichoic acid biosynthesis glycosyltransferase